MIFIVGTKAWLLSNEVVNDPVNMLLYKIGCPRPFVRQNIIRDKIDVVPTPTIGVLEVTLLWSLL